LSKKGAPGNRRSFFVGGALPDWTLPRLAESNPYIWMVEVNGMRDDMRDMPREVQVIAYEKGLIPYIPADR
jgi:hypothetical protein